MSVLCVLSEAEMGPDTTDSGIMEQHLPADTSCRWKQRPITVHDSTILTARLRTSHAGMYAAAVTKAHNSPCPENFTLCCGIIQIATDSHGMAESIA